MCCLQWIAFYRCEHGSKHWWLHIEAVVVVFLRHWTLFTWILDVFRVVLAFDTSKLALLQVLVALLVTCTNNTFIRSLKILFKSNPLHSSTMHFFFNFCSHSIQIKVLKHPVGLNAFFYCVDSVSIRENNPFTALWCMRYWYFHKRKCHCFASGFSLEKWEKSD